LLFASLVDCFYWVFSSLFVWINRDGSRSSVILLKSQSGTIFLCTVWINF
jgi:hypothetical protein